MLDSRTFSRRILSAAILCAALVLLVTGAFAFAARAHAQTPQRIDGQILNGTAGMPANRVANLDVTLFQMGASGPITHTVKTDAQGQFAFDDLKLDASSPLFAQVDYQGIHYFSDILTPDVVASKPLTLTVYETQPPPANFQIDGAHLILDVGQKTLNVVELIQVTNSTDRAFMLRLPLPENASANVQFNDPRDQFRAVRGDDGSVSFPILPTTNQILLGMQLTTKPPSYVLNVQTPVQLTRLNVLVSQTGGVQAASPQLQPGAPFTPQGTTTTYTQLNGDNIPANSTVAVSLSNLPGADNSGLVRSVVLGAGGLAALALLGVAVLRRGDGGNEEDTMAASDRVAQLNAIATLDDAFEAGEIGEEDYLAQRAALKAELMQDASIHHSEARSDEESLLSTARDSSLRAARPGVSAAAKRRARE
jgi:hypothetical protein